MAESLLIVGKNNRNRTILKRALSSIYEVIEAVGIGVALDILYAEKIRAIFIDTFESENASMDFLKIVRGQKRYLSLPIFVMISENNEGLEIKALSMGATDFFFSTFNPALLLNRVKNEFEKQLAIESAKRDNLTGVYNRYGLESNIDLSILYNGGKRKMALGIIDIDNFKAVNDTYGHKFGDKALCCVVDSISEVCRANDIVGRLGGDELMVVINDFSDDDNLQRIVDRIMFTITENTKRILNIKITCSMGVSILGLHGANRTELYMNADEALYSAKNTGKNSWAIYSPHNNINYLKDGREILSSKSASQIGFYDNYFGSLQDSVYACDASTYDIIYANDALCKFLGVPLEKALGQKCYSTFFGRSSPCEFCTSTVMVDKYGFHDFFYPENNKYYRMIGRLFEWNGIFANVHRITNITSEKYVEIAKKEKYIIMAELLKRQNIGFWIYDFKEKVLIDVNYDSGGYKGENGELSSPFEIVENNILREDCKQEYYNMYDKILSGEKTAEGDFWIKKQSSMEYMQVHIDYKTVFDDNGNPIMAVGHSINI